jgi:hypothetical protein
MKLFALFLLFLFFGGVLLRDKHPLIKKALLLITAAFLCIAYLYLDQI